MNRQVVVTGLGVISPVGNNVASFWNALLEGKSGIDKLTIFDPADFDTVKLTLGIVELDDGNKITGQLNLKNPKIGMKVKGEIQVVRQELYEKRLGMVFTDV